MIKEQKLTQSQMITLKALSMGSKTENGGGMKVLVQGKKICQENTMMSLMGKGLVTQVEVNGEKVKGSWEITAKGFSKAVELGLVRGLGSNQSQFERSA